MKKHLVLTLASLTAIAGCGQTSTPKVFDAPVAPTPNEVQGPDISTKKGIVHQVGGKIGVFEEIKLKNQLRQIALFYNQYVSTFGRPPKDEKAFVEFIARSSPQITRAIEKKTIAVVPNVRPLRSSSMLAYVKLLNRFGKHIIVTGDRRLRAVSAAELKKLLPK